MIAIQEALRQLRGMNESQQKPEWWNRKITFFAYPSTEEGGIVPETRELGKLVEDECKGQDFDCFEDEAVMRALEKCYAISAEDGGDFMIYMNDGYVMNLWDEGEPVFLDDYLEEAWGDDSEVFRAALEKASKSVKEALDPDIDDLDTDDGSEEELISDTTTRYHILGDMSLKDFIFEVDTLEDWAKRAGADIEDSEAIAEQMQQETYESVGQEVDLSLFLELVKDALESYYHYYSDDDEYDIDDEQLAKEERVCGGLSKEFGKEIRLEGEGNFGEFVAVLVDGDYLEDEKGEPIYFHEREILGKSEGELYVLLRDFLEDHLI